MNSRERLKEWAEYAADRDMQEDAIALRKLDNLMVDFVKAAQHGVSMIYLLERAKAAGYGDNS